MSDNIFGGSNGGNERGKRKNTHTLEKPPKQSRRGLGVAQLERIRLQREMEKGCHHSFHSPYYTPSHTNMQESFLVPTAGYSYSSMASSSFAHSTPASAAYNGLQQSIMMRVAGYERANKCIDLQSVQDARWGAGNTNLAGHSFTHPSITARQLPNLQQKDSNQKKRSKNDSVGSSNQHCGSSNFEEIDLELRL